MKQPEFRVDLVGEPADVQAMLAVASQVEPAIFGKQWVNPGHLILRYRADEPRLDLLAAIQQAAGLPDSEPAVEEVLDVAELLDEEHD